jgi:arginine/lysine/histidine transporter system substrate-binding protein
MKKILLYSLLIAGALALLWYKKTAPPAEADLLRTIIIGTSADLPPFSFRDEHNQVTGFDIDVAKEVAKRLKKDYLIEDLRFEMLLPELQLGHIHMIAAGMTVTPERAKTVLFTKPYLSGNPLVVVTLAKNPITKLEDLKNKEIVVNSGYTADTYMSKLPDIKLTRLQTVAEAFAALEKGAAFAFVTAANTLKPVFEKHQESKFNQLLIPETDENDALAISPKYEQLLVEIQKALDQMETEGTIDALKQKWKLV